MQWVAGFMQAFAIKVQWNYNEELHNLYSSPDIIRVVK
jgi:hypothetical protein